MLRYGLVGILVAFGTAKWSSAEAEAIRPWVEHSPFMSWIYSLASVQNASIAIGVIELVIAALILVRHWWPVATVIGSAMAVGMFLTTLSFLVTTPHLSAELQGFLLKDFFLLGTAVWSLGESMSAVRARSPE